MGYTDVHPSFDCADALMGTEELFFQIADDPDYVKAVTEKCFEPFFPLMDAFHEKLKAHGSSRSRGCRSRPTRACTSPAATWAR